MSFTWPFALLLLLAVPVMLAGYLLAMRRRRRQAITYSSIALLRAAVPRAARWRRHLPLAALLASLAVLAVASARPQITTEVPVDQTSIILALDDSGSMCSTDLLPNRLSVAQSAAREFVNSQPSGVRMGLVVFSGFAELVVAPTGDHKLLDRAINNLNTHPGTAIGAAILESLDAISEVDPQVQPVGNALSTAAAQPSAAEGATGNSGGEANPVQQKPARSGYVPDIIVLLTDGANNRGITPLQAVPYAVARRVRIYTIGFGTTHPGPLVCTPQQQGGFGGFGGGGFGGGGYGGGGYGYGGGFRSPLVADLPPLREVSGLTGGQSYAARNASQLNKVFANLAKHVAIQHERHEVTADFAIIGALLVLAALVASSRWSVYP
ncbi:MAG: VWA domain-containing protein [Acidimicrobiales bacterium]